MNKVFKRRGFLKTLAGLPAVATVGSLLTGQSVTAQKIDIPIRASRLKLSLNAFSFNEPLRKGSMTLFDLLSFCADQNFDAVDLTAYYFPGYPVVPPDEYLYQLKQKAFLLGLDISGTGVRNDFAQVDANKRKADVELVKDWIVAASKIGAPVIRIFAGQQVPQGFSWQQTADWMVKDIMECVAFGKEHGVIVAMQNHHDFIKTATEAETIIKMVDSNWFGLVLDIGSYRGPDPYDEIARTAKHAVNWQLKEKMYVNQVEQTTDLNKVLRLVKASGYRGYVPIETLGEGDPKIKVPRFLAEVRKALG